MNLVQEKKEPPRDEQTAKSVIKEYSRTLCRWPAVPYTNVTPETPALAAACSQHPRLQIRCPDCERIVSDARR
jgi:hypothetical protein